MTDNPEKPECTMATDICEIRDQIDSIDDTILELINRRLNLAKRIGELKKDSGNRVVDSTRESEILRRLTAMNKGPLNPNVLQQVHHVLHHQGRCHDPPFGQNRLGCPKDNVGFDEDMIGRLQVR